MSKENVCVGKITGGMMYLWLKPQICKAGAWYLLPTSTFWPPSILSPTNISSNNTGIREKNSITHCSHSWHLTNALWTNTLIKMNHVCLPFMSRSLHNQGLFFLCVNIQLICSSWFLGRRGINTTYSLSPFKDNKRISMRLFNSSE